MLNLSFCLLQLHLLQEISKYLGTSYNYVDVNIALDFHKEAIDFEHN